ncbi:MAG: L-carnitine CoA-transferase [Actinomycetaceae bacterium]|nr:L-carnitine CoA-transferase [Actinomycetaceae bacterium]
MSIPMEKPSFGVLDGLKVVYSAVEIATPTACEIMAEWGADVTWIENTFTGDSMRDTHFVKEMERRNMRSISMNPFTEDGKKIILEMVKDADIFLESSKGPVWARKGITDEMLWEVNPKLVIVHISGFGHTGDPRRVNAAAYDLTVQDYSGYIYQNGTPEQPMTAAPYTGDYFNALMVVSSALAAVYRAGKTGQGESIDLAMYETMLRVGVYYMLDYLNKGVEYPRAGARNQNLCAIGQYKCADGFVGLCVYGVPQNKYLLETIGLGHLWGTEEYPEDTSALWLASPKAELIEQKLEEYLLTRNAEDIERDFTENRIAAQKMLTFDDIVAEEHVKLRQNFMKWETKDGDEVTVLNTVPAFKNAPGGFWRPMPELGYDTRDILLKAGFSEAEIQRMADEGTIRLGD